MKMSHSSKKACLLSLFCCAGLSLHAMKDISEVDRPVISDYDACRDQAAVKDLVEQFPHQLSSWSYVNTHLKNDTSHRAKVMRLGTETIGFCAYCEFNGNWCIRFLGINPTIQSKGYGRQLIAEAENTVQKFGKDRIDITVVDDNDRAHSLYTRLGYKPNGNAFSHVFLLTKPLTGQAKKIPRRLKITRRPVVPTIVDHTYRGTPIIIGTTSTLLGTCVLVYGAYRLGLLPKVAHNAIQYTAHSLAHYLPTLASRALSWLRK